jgi:hypothetical protein
VTVILAMGVITTTGYYHFTPLLIIAAIAGILDYTLPKLNMGAGIRTGNNYIIHKFFSKAPS